MKDLEHVAFRVLAHEHHPAAAGTVEAGHAADRVEGEIGQDAIDHRAFPPGFWKVKLYCMLLPLAGPPQMPCTMVGQVAAEAPPASAMLPANAAQARSFFICLSPWNEAADRRDAGHRQVAELSGWRARER